MPHKNGALARNDRRERIEDNMVEVRRLRRRKALIQFEMGTAKFLRYDAVHDLKKDGREWH